ncbi:MAG: hypothetical protein QNJ09_10855 [Paracoccaceae bacterium]|nr:hypothetical protein [Paracoccaceae bacterium]
MIRTAFVFLVCATGVLAEPFAMRSGDIGFDPDAMRDRLSGQILTFYDDGQSEYYVDGRYTYTYANDGGTAYGYWRVEDTGAVCIDFVNGFSRCDLYVRNGDRLLLIDENGARFPVRD